MDHKRSTSNCETKSSQFFNTWITGGWQVEQGGGQDHALIVAWQNCSQSKCETVWNCTDNRDVLNGKAGVLKRQDWIWESGS